MAPGGNAYIVDALSDTQARQQHLVDAVVSGFYPISRSSPLCFARVVEIAEAYGLPEASELAQQIALAETGERSLVDWYAGVDHPQSFLRTVSAASGCVPAPDEVLGQTFLDELGAREATIGLVLGYCEMIEAIAPHTTNWIAEFVAQWAVLTGRPFSQLWWPYLCEHLLTEGDDSHDQHIRVVSALVDAFRAHCSESARAEGRVRYADLTARHLDRVVVAVGWSGVREPAVKSEVEVDLPR